jgi:hypothetical protein
MNHKQTRTHKIHHSPDLGETTTFPLIVFFLFGHMACTQMSFCLGTPKLGIPKFSKLDLSQLWKPVILCLDLRLKWGLKQTCNPHEELSNGMWHATYTKGNQGYSWFLVIKNQIGNLTPNPSFGHNLCFKYPNWSYEPIFKIYIPRNFQWHKKLFNPMIFNLCNWLLKIWDFIETSTPKVEAHLGMCGFIASHSLTLLRAWNVSLRLHSWPAPLQALALVASPK